MPHGDHAQIIIDIVAPGAAQTNTGWLNDLQKQIDKANKDTTDNAIRQAKRETQEKEIEAKRQQRITDQQLQYNIKAAQTQTKVRSDEEKKLERQLEIDLKKGQKLHEDTDKLITKSSKAAADARMRIVKIEGNEQLAQLRKQERAVQESAQKSGSFFSSAFGGALVGGAIGGALGSIMSGLKSVWSYADVVGTKLFDMAKSGSDYGRTIAGFMALTGFSAKSASALSYAVGLIGKELTDIQRPMIFFTRQLDAAEHGSDKAKAALLRLGITKFDNLQAAFAQATKNVTGTANEVERLGKITGGFGARGGADIQKVMFKMNGDFLGFIETAEKLGVTLSDKDVKAAKEFGHAYETVMFQAKLAAIKFSLAYADNITDAIKKVSRVLSDHKDEWKTWGQTVGYGINGVWKILSGVVGWMASRPNLLKLIAFSNPLSAAGFMAMTELLNYGAGGDLTRTPPTDRPDIANDPRNPFFKGGSKSGGSGKGGTGFIGGLPVPGSVEPHPGYSDEDLAIDITPGGGRKAKEKKDELARLVGNADVRKYQAALSRLAPGLKAQILQYASDYSIPEALALAQIFAESTFKPGAQSPNNPGVGPAYGIGQAVVGTASHVLGRKVTGEQLKKDPALSLTVWGKYMSTLFDKYHDWNLAVLAYHQGEGTVDKLVAALDKGKSGAGIIGPKGKAYLTKISAISGVSGDALTTAIDPEKKSDAITKQYHDRMLSASIEAWTKVGLLPDDAMISEWHQVVVERERKKGLRQPTLEEVKKGFAGLSPATKPFEGEIGIWPLSVGDQRFRDQYDGLHIKERELELDRKRQFFAQDLQILIRDYNLSLQEQLQDTITENKLLEKRNLAIEASVRLEQERNGLNREIGDLKIALMIGSTNDGLKIQAAHLRDILDLRNRDLDAVISINRSQLELSHAMEISNKQVRAGINDHMAQQRTLQGGVIEGWNETYDAINKVVNGPLEKLNEKTKGFAAFIIRPIEAMQTQALNNIWGGIVDKVFGADNPIAKGLKSTGNPMLDEAKTQTDYLKQIVINTGGGAGVNPTTGSGIWNMIPGLGGRGMGPGGTPYFNPTAGGGHGPGAGDPVRMVVDANGQHMEDANGRIVHEGRLGGLRSMFDPQKNPLTGKMNSALAGRMGGIGSIASLIGGFVPGRGGRVLQYAGMGMQIGSMFGPIGAGIGAGVGALFGLFGHGDDAIKKLRSAALATYSIEVKDKSILESIKQIGEGYYGKGQVGRNATDVVALDEVKEILLNYAESSGQKSSQLENLHHTDANWSGNQFGSKFGGFREMGGSVKAGYSYIVGERRPEVFTPTVNGTIAPAVPNVSTTSGIDGKLLAALAESIYGLQDEIATLKSKPAGVIVREGAADAAPEIAAAQADHYGNDWSARERTARQGQM